jgi:predicted amidohydrolase
MSYTVGVNRVGKDGNGHEYTGSSKVLDCLGNDLTSIPVSEEKIATIVLNKKDQEQSRKKFNFLSDRDQFEINESF